MIARTTLILTTAALTTVATCADLLAQAENQPAPGHVTLNFPETVELKILIDYVARRHAMNFIYDEQIAAKKITIKATQPVPAESLLTLLESILKMNALSLSKTKVPGTMRIEAAGELTKTSVGLDAAPDPNAAARPTLALTRVFELKHAPQKRVEDALTPFLSGTTANVIALSDVVIVTDYADNMPRIEKLMALIDRPGRQVEARFIAVENLAAETLSQKVAQFFAAKAKSAGQTPAPNAGAVTLVADDRTNQIAVFGQTDEVDQAMRLIRSLDVPLGLETKVYPLAVASPEQIDRIIRKMIGELAVKRVFQSTTEPEANMLIVTTTPAIHAQIEALRLALDKPKSEAQSPVRFYKLENANAADVLATLQTIEGDQGITDVSVDGVSAERSPAPPRDQPREPEIRGPDENQVNAQQAGAADAASPDAPRRGVKLRDARVIADEPTNTIIVVAAPSAHPVYERLIKRLDVRRPQVLVEATVVSLDTTDGFTLGVELHGNGSGHGGRYLNFTQFGLTTSDSLPGSLTLSPGIGFTGALLDGDIAEFVIRALETDSRAKVVSRPSVLINDNAVGTLLSQAEEPFESVNASTTVATTSFAGFASAGTNIKITPQISEGDFLKLKYEITLSSFADDKASPTLPPSRQTNTLKSEATIPDGHTIVVGGLTRENFMDQVDRVPVLGRIPGLEYLLSSRGSSETRTTLFVFIRAVILRDDQFKDLKVLSGHAIERADLPHDFPTSEPVEIE